VVDVAVGSGALVPALREAAGPDGLVLTLDRSIGMLRRVSAPVPRVQSDAARLPLADASADVVVASFVLFLLPDAAGAPAFPDLPRSDHLTDSPDALAALLHERFTDVVTTARPLDAHFDAESALAMRTGCGALGWRFRRLDPARQEEVRARLVSRIAALDPDSLVDRSEVLLTSARRTG
jgi:hypothetical protein